MRGLLPVLFIVAVAAPVGALDLYLTDQEMRAPGPEAVAVCGTNSRGVYAMTEEVPAPGSIAGPMTPAHANNLQCSDWWEYELTEDATVTFPVPIRVVIDCPGVVAQGAQRDMALYLNFPDHPESDTGFGETATGPRGAYNVPAGTICPAAGAFVLDAVLDDPDWPTVDVPAGHRIAVQIAVMVNAADANPPAILTGPNGSFVTPWNPIEPPIPTTILDPPRITASISERTIHASYTYAGNATDARWDLGDGNLMQGHNITHTYAEPGNYTLSLSLTTENGPHSSQVPISTWGAPAAETDPKGTAVESTNLQNIAILAAPAAVGTGLLATFWAMRPRRGLAFLPFPFFWLFTRVKKDDLLKHPVRAALHGLIQASPGIHFQDLVRLSEKGNGTVAHHLGMMDAAGIIGTIRTAGMRCYYLPGEVDRHVVLPLATLRAPNPDLIARHLWRSPDQGVADLVRQTGLGRKAVRVALDALVKHGLVAKGDQRPVYRLEDAAQPLLRRP